MDADRRTESADDLCRSSDERDMNTKIKSKRPSVFGKLKDRILGHKKRRTRSHDSAKDTPSDTGSLKASSTTELTEEEHQRVQHGHSSNSNTMSISVDSIFSPEDLNLPKTGIIGMKNTSASLEALSTGSKLKSELERKLINRRSLDDDGLPGSPIGTPTTSDVLNQSHFLKNNNRKSQDPYRTDRDSDGSLLSIGSSENEEDSFFKNPWKGAHTSAIRRRRRGTLSSDSESDDTLDFDSVAKTESLSNSAAMHKRNVRPKHRAKTRRVIAAPGQMPSLAEKKTLEIAHTFLDEGERTPMGKLRNLDQSSHPAVTVRRTDSDRTYNSPSAQRKADYNVTNDLRTKSPKPVVRSATTNSNIAHNRQGSAEESKHQNELLSVFQRFKPPQTLPPTLQSKPSDEQDKLVSPVTQRPPITDNKKVEQQPPPRPAKTVVFSGTPPLQRRNKAPAVHPRPKSMFPQQTRSKTQEIQGSNIEEALTNISYSKSFNVADPNKSYDALLKERYASDEEKTQSLPEWAKLAKRKTWVVSDPEPEQPKITETVPVATKLQPHSRPVPVPRTGGRNLPIGNGDQDTISTKYEQNELEGRLFQLNLKSNNTNISMDTQGANNDSFRKASSPLEERPLLYSPTGRPQPQPTRSDKGPTVRNRKTSYDNVNLGSYGFYSERKTSPNSEEPQTSKETIVMPKPRPMAAPTSITDELATSNDRTPPMAEPPWKASLKQRTGSLRTTPIPTTEVSSSLTPPVKPAWKSATLKERTTPSLMSSIECLDDILLPSQAKSKTIELPARKPNPMTVSESSAYSKDSSLDDTPEGEEPKSFRDRLKMFQSK